MLSKSRNFIVHYFSAENLKKLAYRKINSERERRSEAERKGTREDEEGDG